MILNYYLLVLVIGSLLCLILLLILLRGLLKSIKLFEFLTKTPLWKLILLVTIFSILYFSIIQIGEYSAAKNAYNKIIDDLGNSSRIGLNISVLSSDRLVESVELNSPQDLESIKQLFKSLEVVFLPPYIGEFESMDTLHFTLYRNEKQINQFTVISKGTIKIQVSDSKRFCSVIPFSERDLIFKILGIVDGY